MPRRKCKGCDSYTIPAGSDARVRWCSSACMDVVIKALISQQRASQAKQRAKAQTKKDTAFKAKKKAFYSTDKTTRRKAAIIKCHTYIRERDAGLPCISCARPITGKADAGHYIPAGSCTALRFDVRNINLQCVLCNQFHSGALRGYREGLIRKIGLDQVLDLEGPQPIIKITADFYRAVEIEFADKIKVLRSHQK